MRIMEVVETGFRNSKGRVAYGARKVLDLVGEDGVGSIEMYRPGVEAFAGQIVLDPTLMKESYQRTLKVGKLRWIAGKTDFEKGYIRVNPFNPDGSRRTPAQLALVIIHEYAHMLGANERLARRIEYFAYLRLKQSQYASEINPNSFTLYVDKAAETAWSLGGLLRAVTPNSQEAKSWNARANIVEKALERMRNLHYREDQLRPQSKTAMGGFD